MNIFTNFINGLRKSFSGERYTRELNVCIVCKEPAFTNMCGYCRAISHYKISEEQERRKDWR